MSEARAYVDAWLAREPAMEVARVFCPPPQRELFELWGALLHQLDEAAFELRDATVANAKLAWWAEELATMAARTARHPLARALSAHDAVRAVSAPDWHALVHAAMLAGASEQLPADTDALLAQGAPYARAIARIEARVFAGRAPASEARATFAGTAGAGNDGTGMAGTPPSQEAADPAPHSEAIAIHHVLRRLEHSLGRDAARFPWPMNLRARHQAAPEAFAEGVGSPQAGAALADLAGGLHPRLQGLRDGILFRRCQSVLDARRLRQLQARRLAPLRAAGIGLAWTLWRAARRGA